MAVSFDCFKIGPEHIVDLVGLASGQTQGKQQVSTPIFELQILYIFPFVFYINSFFTYILLPSFLKVRGKQKEWFNVD